MVAHNPASELPSLQGIVGTRLDKPPPTVIAFGPSRLKQPPTPSAWSSEPAGAVLWLASTQIIHREETTTSHHWLRSTPQSPFHPFSVEIFRSSIQLGPPSRYPGGIVEVVYRSDHWETLPSCLAAASVTLADEIWRGSSH